MLGFADDVPPVHLRGYDPTAYLLTGKPTKGDPNIHSDHEGFRYNFSSAENKKKFDDEPEKYLPQYGGWCTTALGGMYGNRIEPDPEVFDVVFGKVYLFSQQRAKLAYDKDPPKYINRARELWEQPELAGHCPVTYQTEGKAVLGDPKFACVYRARRFHLAGDEARLAFVKDVDKYLPQYRGFCAEGIAGNKRFPGDPKVFLVINGKTYLFFDEKVKAEFNADAAAMVKKADALWPTLRDMK